MSANPGSVAPVIVDQAIQLQDSLKKKKPDQYKEGEFLNNILNDLVQRASVISLFPDIQACHQKEIVLERYGKRLDKENIKRVCEFLLQYKALKDIQKKAAQLPEEKKALAAKLSLKPDDTHRSSSSISESEISKFRELYSDSEILELHKADRASSQLTHEARRVVQEIAQRKSQDWAELGTDYRSSECNRLLTAICQLRQLVLNRLRAKATDEDEKRKLTERLLVSAEENVKQTIRVEAKVRQSMADREQVKQDYELTIRKLKRQLEEIRGKADEDIRKIEDKTQGNITKLASVWTDRKSAACLEIEMLKKQWVKTVEENRQSEDTLRKNNWKLENELEISLQRYNKEIGVKQEEINKIRAKYNRHKAQLNDLENKFAKAESDYKSVLERQEKETAEKLKVERENYIRTKAALTIQRYWRKYRGIKKGTKKKVKERKKKRGGNNRGRQAMRK